MKKSTGKKKITFYNYSRSLDNVIQFLEAIQKKINFLDLYVIVEGPEIKITIRGSRDLQYLATQKLKELAEQFLKESL